MEGKRDAYKKDTERLFSPRPVPKLQNGQWNLMHWKVFLPVAGGLELDDL